MIPYSNIHLVVFPRGAGGKFLVNCLSLNDKTVFQDSTLAKKQIDNNFSITDKYNYLLEKLKIAKQNKEWTDLDLTTRKLFGDAMYDFGSSDLSIIEKKIKSRTIFQECVKNELHMFLPTTNLNEIHQKKTTFSRK